MNTFDKVIAWSTAVFSVVCSFLPNLTTEQKIISILVLFILSISILYIKLNRKFQKAISSLSDVTERHKALVFQFDENRKRIMHYKEALENIARLLTIAVQLEESAKIKTVFTSFLEIQSKLIDGGRYDETTL